MKPPTLTIIIPVYNAGETDSKIIKTIINQSFTDFELLLIDDGSSDSTLTMLRSYEIIDSRVKVFTKPNGGPSSARNLGIEKAIGKYIQFYDADDDIEPSAISTVVKAIKSNESDLVVSGWQIDLSTDSGLVKGYKRIEPKQEVVVSGIKTFVVRSLGSSGTLYNLWNKLFRAEIIKENSLRFDEHLRFGEDLLFSLEYLKYAKRIDVIPTITYHYQTNSKTSVFASSSLVPEYRTANDEGLLKFIGESPTGEIYDLSQWLRWRWLMSYWSQVSSSKNVISEKITLINSFRPRNLTIAKNTQHIGTKRYLLELVSSTARMNTLLSLILGFSFKFIRSVIKAIKLGVLRLQK